MRYNKSGNVHFANTEHEKGAMVFALTLCGIKITHENLESGKWDADFDAEITCPRCKAKGEN